jgi:hypothetical protein
MAPATAKAMNEKQTPHNQEGEPPTRNPKETAQRLEQKADEQQGEMNRARTEGKAREVKEEAETNGETRAREVRFGG